MSRKCTPGKEVISPPGHKKRRCVFKTESVPETLFKDKEDLEETEKRKNADKNKPKRKCPPKQPSTVKKPVSSQSIDESKLEELLDASPGNIQPEDAPTENAPPQEEQT